MAGFVLQALRKGADLATIENAAESDNSWTSQALRRSANLATANHLRPTSPKVANANHESVTSAAQERESCDKKGA
jgi:hypothetical protein